MATSAAAASGRPAEKPTGGDGLDFVARVEMMKFSQGMGKIFESSRARHAKDPVDAMRKACNSARLAGDAAKMFEKFIDEDGKLEGDIDDAMAAAEAAYAMSQMLAVESYVAGRLLALEKARRERAKGAEPAP